MIYDGTNVNVYNFGTPGTINLYRTVTSTLYSGDITIATTTIFDVSDDCNAIRIDNKIFHYFISSSNYVLDTYATGTASLSNPVFS